MRFFRIVQTMAYPTLVLGMSSMVIKDQVEISKKRENMIKENPNARYMADRMFIKGHPFRINERMVDEETGEIVARI